MLFDLKVSNDDTTDNHRETCFSIYLAVDLQNNYQIKNKWKIVYLSNCDGKIIVL